MADNYGADTFGGGFPLDGTRVRINWPHKGHSPELLSAVQNAADRRKVAHEVVFDADPSEPVLVGAGGEELAKSVHGALRHFSR